MLQSPKRLQRMWILRLPLSADLFICDCAT